jgi:VPDSG-CTERM motif
MSRTKFFSKPFLIVAAGLLGFAFASSSWAVPVLFLSYQSGAGTITQTVSFSNGNTYTGVLGNFSLNITLGAPTADALLPELDVTAQYAAGRVSGALTILFSDVSFGNLPGSINSQISGATSGLVASGTYADAGNNAFATTTLLGSSGPFSNGPFSGNSSGTFAVPQPFSITEKIVISSNFTSGSTSFGTKVTDPVLDIVTVPDTGATLSLLGLALLGIGIARRKLAAL